MATTVGEVMNREVFSVREGDRADDALAALFALRLSAAPVLDDARRPVGIVSWRDLINPGSTEVGPRMSKPVDTVLVTDRIEAAAAVLAASGLHHAPVVDVAGVVVGFLSSVDLLRGLVGQPAAHPPGFPHFDESTGVVWTDDQPLSEAHLDAAPDGMGVIAYVEGGRARPERLIFAEATHNIRSRLLDRLSEPPAEPQLGEALATGRLRYRASSIQDPKQQDEVLARLRRDMREREWFENVRRR